MAAGCRDRRGAAAVEFALVAMPFIMLLLGIIQLAVYFMTQSSLDSGVVKAADTLVNSYYASTAPTAMTPAALKSLVVASSGGLIRNDGTLAVELREMTNLNTAVVPIGNVVDMSSPRDVLALRAQAFVWSVVPGMGMLSVRSTAIVRRQAL